ncbi:unnamed protein product [Mytilus coruscus]|uniref:Uncharacterized protein n=1 Tax=Mytilus coruscus TaxID=42192 RepID=A0A6J8E2Y9_MYTCO|nr:unnamed protein product [Mytilus coruscus]
MWDLLIDVCTTQRLTLQHEVVHIDFKCAMHTAVTKTFHAATISCCRFYLGQSWWRKIQSIGLSADYKDKDSDFGKWLTHFFGLAYLSTDKIEECFVELIADAPSDDKCMKFRYPSHNYTLQTICTTGINPGGIALDYVLGHVYFTHDRTKICKCNLDGSNAVDIHTSLKFPFALGLDVTNGWMYFSENGVPRKMVISRFDLSQRQDIYTQSTVAYSLDLGFGRDYKRD